MPVDEFKAEHIDVLKNEHPGLNKIILSATKNYSEELKKALQQNFKQFIELDANTPIYTTTLQLEDYVTTALSKLEELEKEVEKERL